jgi:UDP-glucose 4-epimerase
VIRPILVTGAGGFVGRHLVQRLTELERPMRLALRSAASALPQWRDSRLIDIVETGDLAAPRRLDAALAHVDTVVHLAGLAHAPRAAETAFYRANDEATSVVVAAARRHGARRFIHLGSIAALCGHASSRVISDATVAAPVTAYGRSKYAAEAHVSGFGQEGRTMAVTLRPPLIVAADAPGNWGRLQRLADSAMPLPSSADNRRSYVSITTIVEAIAHLVTAPPDPARSGAYCIADDEPLSLSQVLAELRAAMGRPRRTLELQHRVWSGLRAVPPLRRTIDSLAGDLVIDPSRFFQTFPIQPASLRREIGKAGEVYSSRRRT